MSDIRGIARAAIAGAKIASEMVPGAVFKTVNELLRGTGVSPQYKEAFRAGFYHQLGEMYPNGVHLATINGIPDTIIPE